MKKFVALSGWLSVGLFFAANPGWGQSFEVMNGQNVTSQETLSTGQTGLVDAGGTLNVNSTSKLASIIVTGNATITNSGTIEQSGAGRAIRDNTGNLTLNVTNQAGGTIEATDNDVFQMNVAGSTVTLNNHGAITASGTGSASGQAIDWNALNTTTGSNTLNNYSTGVIQAADADGVRPGVNGVITNDGTIEGFTVGDSGNDGIDAQTNSGVSITNANTNTSNALILGAAHGITGGDVTGGVFTMSITNNSRGTIQGNDGSGINIDGINGNELVTIINTGTITGDGVTGDGDGVDVDGLVNLNNSGTIKSLNSLNDTSEGVTVGGGTIINSGTIEGEINSPAGNIGVGRGITLAGVDKDSSGNPIPIEGIYANTTVTNSGLIKGDSDSGIAVEGPATGFTITITNQAGGVIEGGGATAVAIQTGADNDTVINSGAIIADSSGKAVDLGGGTNSLQILGGAASIIGDISGGTGTSSLTIDPGTGNSFSYAGAISNFSSVENKSGTVTLTGASTYAGPTTISGGTTYIDNINGSGTGTSAVEVKGGATFGGTGTMQPSGTNALTVDANGTLAPGGVQPAAITNGTTNNANGNLTIDTTNFTPGANPTPNTILGITSAKLTFALGSGDATSGSQIVITGGIANTIAFAGTTVVTINDLVAANLTLNQEYVLIAGNNTTFTGLTLDASTSLGQRITGGLTLDTSGDTFSQDYGASQLYLVGDNIEVEIQATPEPGVWAMLIGGCAVAFVSASRRRSKLKTA